MKDIHGKAILAYYLGDRTTRLKLHNSYGPIDIMPIDVFFKEAEDFSDLENMALSHCRGAVLDIGAAAGTHALFLQSFGANVTALDSSSGCVETMKRSSVQHVVQQDYRQHQATYDTLLLLMNGIGIAGTLDQLPDFFNKCKSLLNPGGQLLLDSSDIAYLYADGLAKPEHYYGEIRYRYEYDKEQGDWFDWLYVDATHLNKAAQVAGFELEILHTDAHDQYLAKLQLI